MALKPKIQNKISRYQTATFAQTLKQKQEQAHKNSRQSVSGWTWRDIFIDIVYVLGVAGLLALVGALLYWPKLFFIQKIEINGALPLEQSAFESTVDSWIAHGSRVLPRKNLLLLQVDSLREEILNTHANIDTVVVQKKFPHGLEVRITYKRELFLVTGPGKNYVVFDDGTVAASLPEIPQDAEGFLQISLPDVVDVPVNTLLLDKQLNGVLEFIAEHFTQIIPDERVKVATFLPTSSAPPYFSKEITLLLESTEAHPVFNVFINSGGDAEHDLNQLKLLMGNLSSERLSALSYIDLRFADKFFICLVRTSCDTSAAVQ